MLALRVLVVLVVSGMLFLAPRAASAHTVGLSSGEYRASGSGLSVTLAFARADVARLAPRLDRNGDGHVTALELEAGRSDLDRAVFDRIVVERSGARCPHVLREAELTDQDGLTLRGRFDCPATPGAPFEVHFALGEDLPEAHRHVARAIGVATHDDVLSRSHEDFSVVPDAVSVRASARPGFFAMGVQHILTGYDHLVFVLALVLLRTPLGRLLGIVTSFTVAHSLSLALATTGVLAPPSRFVEPAIALSIAWVGVENLVLSGAAADVAERRSSRRWMLTFAFGLIHGFGFAGALQEIQLPRARIPSALLTFNLGVEAGQLAVLMTALPLIRLLDRTPWFAARGVRLASAGVALAGVVWFVARLTEG